MWAKLDDKFPHHPKVIKAGPEAAWLYICGLCYCAEYLTDGKIPPEQLRLLADVDKPIKLAEILLDVGLWEEGDRCFVVHDYLKYNPSREQALKEKEAHKLRQEKYRQKNGRFAEEV